jgi:hypothetical protein
VDFVALTVDGQQVVPEKVELRGGRQAGSSDVYFRWVDETAGSGPRFAEATGRVRETGAEIVRTLQF